MSTYQFTTPTLKYYPYFWSTTAINTSDCSPLDLPPPPTTPSHTTVPPGHVVMTENYPGLPQERSPCRHCNGPRKWGRCLFAGGREIFTKEFSVPNSNCPAVCFLLHLFCISGMSRCRQNEKKQSQDVKRIDCTFKDRYLYDGLRLTDGNCQVEEIDGLMAAWEGTGGSGTVASCRTVTLVPTKHLSKTTG